MFACFGRSSAESARVEVLQSEAEERERRVGELEREKTKFQREANKAAETVERAAVAAERSSARIKELETEVRMTMFGPCAIPAWAQVLGSIMARVIFP